MAYYFELQAGDVDGDSLSFSALKLPDWLNLSPAGILYGLPVQADAGQTAEVVVLASDPAGAADSIDFSLPVNFSNDAPYFLSTNQLTATEDQPLNFQLSAEDEDSDSLVFSALEIPDWLSLSSSGRLTGFPGDDQGGKSFNLSLRVNDDLQAADTLTCSLFVGNVNDAPRISLVESITIAEEGHKELDLTPYLADPDNIIAELMISSRWLESGQTALSCQILQQEKRISLQAAPDFNGSFALEITVTDNLLASGRDTLLVIISPLNDPPQIQSLPELTFNEDHPFTLRRSFLTGFSSDIDHSPEQLKFTIQPGRIRVQVDSDTSFILSAAADWFGRDTLTVVVSDPEQAEASTRFPIAVTPINDAPVLTLNGNFELINNDSLTLNLIQFTSDIDHDPAAIRFYCNTFSDSVLIRLRGGNLTLRAPLYRGAGDIEIVASDPGGLSDTARIHLDIRFPENRYDQDGDGIPEKFVLRQNYPNPFNDQTVIEYGLTEAALVVIEIFDITGKRLIKYSPGRLPAGFHKYTWKPGNLASGIYIFRLNAQGRSPQQGLQRIIYLR